MSESLVPPASHLVLSERREGVLILTLNRPERLNAWTEALEATYFAALDAAENDPEVKAIVVTGAGRGFCAGADMDDLEAAGSAGAQVWALDDRPREATFPLTVRKPMIAAINGPAAGFGLVEALYCDVRFAIPQAKFTTAFVRRGLIAECGISWAPPAAHRPRRRAGPAVVGPHRARRGRASARARSTGSANRTRWWPTPWRTRRTSPSTARPGRWRRSSGRVSRTSIATSPLPIGVADALMRDSLDRPDIQEGVRSYLEHRAPAFAPLPPRS